MTLTDKERKAKQKEYDKKYHQKPENKARLKARTSTPEHKAKEKEYDRAYNQRPEVKARKKRWSRTPENKAIRRERELTPKYKAKAKERRAKPENKAKQKEYDSTPERKAYFKKYQQLPKYKAGQKEHADNIRLKVLQYYSKHLSKSDIPCCRCCGEKSHIGFLALDHIAGRKEMDSESGLVKLGYSSSMVKTVLSNWIIKNNFPKGFQILCHNCNQAKAVYGKCPHEK